MYKRKVFLAAPISGFANENEYNQFRKVVLELIGTLRISFDVFSELETISDKNSYDTPADSARSDFQRIDLSDIFILIHPWKLQTSALIELGYAFAKRKTIIIVGPEYALPYLALGFPAITDNARILNVDTLNCETFTKILDELKELELHNTVTTY